MLATQETNPVNQINYDAIKEKQRNTWGSGDYGRIGITLQITGEQLCESMDVKAGQTLLDIAAGNGNITLSAARRFCNVTSTDYVEALLAQSEKRAQAEGLDINYQFADAEDLPFPDNEFDNVASTFGIMFAPDQVSSAAELLRVCKKGGKIGLANWTPEGFIGQLFKLIGRYVPPPAGLQSPALWGTRQFFETHFAAHVEQIEYRVREFNFRFQSPHHWLEIFRTYYGPVHKAFSSLDSEKATSLEKDILDLIEKFNRDETGSMIVPSEYLEVVITK